MTVSYSGSFFRLLLRWKGSIWRSVWLELLIFLALFYKVRLFHLKVIPLLDPDGNLQYKETFKSACHEFNEYTKMIPLTFLLGFYVSNVVSRWWRQFECLSWPEDLLSALCLVLPASDEHTRRVRHQIARYLNLAAALAWRDISAKIRLRFPSLRNLIDAGLLTEKELSSIRRLTDSSPGVAWLTPLHWSQQLIAAEVSAGNAHISFIASLNAELKQYRVSFRRLFCHDWVCVPLVYTQVAALATYAHFAFCLLGRQFVGESIDLFLPIFTIVQFLFFVGWFKVGLDLMRPFGLDDDDIELAYIFDRNLVTSFAIVDCMQTQKPPIWEPDPFWGQEQNRTEGSSLVWGRIDLTRTCHKHPPKLHTYVELGKPDDDDAAEQRLEGDVGETISLSDLSSGEHSLRARNRSNCYYFGNI